MPRVGLLTCARYPEGAPDDLPIADHLRASGIDAEFVVWSDPDLRPADFDALIVRSLWDYHLRLPEFAAWLNAVERSGVPLCNPVEVVRWNMDKRYLRDLQERGAIIVPTRWVDQGSSASLEDLLAAMDRDHAVIKPTVSASAHETWVTHIDDAAANQPRFDALLRDHTLMVQPFIPEVQSPGEWSIIFIDGTYSHAVMKQPQPGDFRSQTEFGAIITPADAPPSLIAQAQAILALVDQPVLYARVDGVVRDAAFMLMELELIEPHLFLATRPRAAERLAGAIRQRITVV
jgi:glutathione synthase/RimK-type ligase-like ATP-grasp enzyme